MVNLKELVMGRSKCVRICIFFVLCLICVGCSNNSEDVKADLIGEWKGCNVYKGVKPLTLSFSFEENGSCQFMLPWKEKRYSLDDNILSILDKKTGKEYCKLQLINYTGDTITLIPLGNRSNKLFSMFQLDSDSGNDLRTLDTLVIHRVNIKNKVNFSEVKFRCNSKDDHDMVHLSVTGSGDLSFFGKSNDDSSLKGYSGSASKEDFESLTRKLENISIEKLDSVYTSVGTSSREFGLELKIGGSLKRVTIYEPSLAPIELKILIYFLSYFPSSVELTRDSTVDMDDFKSFGPAFLERITD